jgi:hypothetical protein
VLDFKNYVATTIAPGFDHPNLIPKLAGEVGEAREEIWSKSWYNFTILYVEYNGQI